MNEYRRGKASDASLIALARSISGHWQLLRQLIWREVIGRYKGSLLGVVWSLITPLLMLTVYTFVFGVVFKSRWGGDAHASTGEFALVLFAGLIVHGLFAEIASIAPRLMIGHSNFVKRVVFPLEILPVASLMGALFHASVSLLILLVATLILKGSVSINALYLPLILLPYSLALLGVAFLLTSVGVYVRDVAQIMAMVIAVMLFLSPVFYPVSAVSGAMAWVLKANPLTLIIESARAVLIWQKSPDLVALLVYLVFSLVLLAAGYWWFQKTRKGFADVL